MAVSVFLAVVSELQSNGKRIICKQLFVLAWKVHFAAKHVGKNPISHSSGTHGRLFGVRLLNT